MRWPQSSGSLLPVVSVPPARCEGSLARGTCGQALFRHKADLLQPLLWLPGDRLVKKGCGGGQVRGVRPDTRAQPVSASRGCCDREKPKPFAVAGGSRESGDRGTEGLPEASEPARTGLHLLSELSLGQLGRMDV